ncbi:MAG: LD-carboxypeptidase [Rhodothermales bacterium]|nr:LD-carboxypeptidase [Rhodothermales bacterium]
MKIRKPPALSPPGPIGIIAPASAPLDEADLTKGLRHLSDAGFETVLFRPDFEPYGFLAGDDDARADELARAFSDESADVLVCVRGGYGSLRLLDRIDYVAAGHRPKLLIGYSDITALQLALLARSGWTSISGPMVAVDWKNPHPASIEQFVALASGRHGADLAGPSGQPLIPLARGSAEGRLIGGNLSLITRLLGTPYLPDLRGAILFLEEIGEPPYRVDGMFAQLHLAGLLGQLAGVVLGGFTDGDPKPGRPSLSFDQVFDHWFGRLGVPVATDLAYGHFPVKSAIPIGVRARLEVSSDRASLKLLETVVDV